MDKLLVPLIISIGVALFLLNIPGVILLCLHRSRRKRFRNLFMRAMPWWVLSALIAFIGIIVAFVMVVELYQMYQLPF